MKRLPPRISYHNDPLARLVMRALLLSQLVSVILTIVLFLSGRTLPAIGVIFLASLLTIAVLLWLYRRYQTLPVVCEKRILMRLVSRFEQNHGAEDLRIHAAIQERTRLSQAEEEEIKTALMALRKSHIGSGLREARIEQAGIPGIGKQLTQRLAGYGIASAADVTNRIAQLPGFGVEKCHALLSWRSAVLAELERTKPAALPPEDLEAIRGKYQALQDENNTRERRAIASQQILEHELISLKPRLSGLGSITFPGYIGKALNRDDAFLPRPRLNWSWRKWFPRSSQPWHSDRRTPRR